MFVATTRRWDSGPASPGSAASELMENGRLPEPFNSAKQILDELTKERHGNRVFRMGSATFAIAQILYRFDKERKLKQQRGDGVKDYLDKHGLKIPRYLIERDSLGGPTWSAVQNCKLEETIVFSDTDAKIRRYNVGGIIAVYIGSEEQFTNSHSPMPPIGPYINLKFEAAFIEAVRDRIWSSRSLQLELQNSWFGDPVFSLTHVESDKDYVPAEDSDANLNVLIERTLLFRDAGHRRRILLHGPPGTGKSTLAHKMSEQIGYGRLLHISSSSLEYLATSMGMIKFMEPDVALIDDIDRADYRAQDFLRELENFPKRIVVFATCNTMDGMDSAILRSGRFDEIYEIGLPKPPHVYKIAEHYANKFGLQVAEETFDLLAGDLDGLSPAAIREFFTTAATVFPECRDDKRLSYANSLALIDYEVGRIKQQAELSNRDFEDDDD